jgi:poly-gamma-glutamate capsule biosynthesis protein CapA/YwtB (metallophosphatase superfamily)
MKGLKIIFVSLISLVLLTFWLPRVFLTEDRASSPPLEFVGFFPAGEEVDIDSLISLELTGLPDPESLEERFSIYPNIPGQLLVDGSKILFIPTMPLDYHTRYLVTVTEGVRGMLGSVLEKTITLEFVTKERPPLKIMAVGDIMLDQLTRQRLKEYDYTYPFAEVKELFKQGDVVFGNLESPISSRGTPLPGKRYAFRAAPFSVKSLVDGGINMVSLANNHIMDYGEEALEDTLEILTEHNIAHAGAGMNLTDAHAGTYLEVQGYRVGLLAYTDDFAVPARFRSLWQAGEQKAGAALLHDRKKIKADIERMRLEVDVLLVSFHWGYEYTHRITAEQRELAYLAVESGADLVLGHHPHVPQGVEVYAGKPIVYSLSNFVFYPFTNYPETLDTFILEAEFHAGEVTALSLIPVRGGNSQPYVPKGPELQGLISRLTRLLENLGTSYEVTADDIIKIRL